MVRLSAIILFFFGFLLSATPTMAAEPPTAPVSVAVTLGSFDALPDANGVRVVWVTLNEENTLGFRLFRGTTPNGAVTRLTGLIPTQAPNGGGARYEFVDSSAEVGNTYYYYVDAIGTNGQTLRYGPAEIDLTPTAVSIGAFNAETHNGYWGWVALLATGVTLAGVVRIRRH
jgi:hypothetical protein